MGCQGLVVAVPTIEKSELKREFEGKYGPMRAYKVRIDGTDGELLQKATTPPPSEGQSIDGTWEEGKFGPVFKKAKPMNGGGFRQRDPKDTARIERMHAQEMALRYLALVPQESGGVLLSDVAKYTDWFVEDTASQPKTLSPEQFIEKAKVEFDATEDHAGALDVISDADVKLLEDEVRRYVESSSNQDQARSVARMKMVEFGVENPDGKLATVLRQLTPDGAKRLLEWLKAQEF